MPTDTERREVAERLRYEADYPGYAVQYMEQFIGDLRQVLFGDLNPTADYSEMFARLADLIEPPTQCPYYHSDRHHCSAYDDVVDRDALLELADEMDGLGLSGLSSGWSCGSVNVGYFARRIREACVEVVA